MKLNLFTKLAIIVAVLAIVPAAVVGILSVRATDQNTRSVIGELHIRLASHLGDDVQNHFNGIDREIHLLRAALTSKGDGKTIMREIFNTNPDIVRLALLDRSGRVILSEGNSSYGVSPVSQTLSRDPFFKEFRENRHATTYGNVYFFGLEPMINVIYPMGSRCLFATISMDSVWRMLTRTRVGATGHAFLTDAYGHLITYPGNPAAVAFPIAERWLRSGVTGQIDYIQPYTQKHIVGAFAPIKGMRWGVIVQQERNEAYAAADRSRTRAWILLMIISLFVILAAIQTARWLTRPFTELIRPARKLLRKKLALRDELRAGDELGLLVATFNEMSSELKRYDRMQVDRMIEDKITTESVMFSINDGILMMDREGRLQLANKHACDLLGLPATNWQDYPLWHFVKTPLFREFFEEIIRSPEKNAVREINLSTPTLKRYFLFTTKEVTNPQRKEAIGLVTVIRNITLEKELEKMKEDFLHSITHDLRNPMTSIRGFLKFLIDEVAGPTTESQRRMLGIIDRSSFRLLTLINDILDIAKLESSQLVLKVSETDLKYTAQKAMELSEGIALKKEISVALDCPDNLPRVIADAELLERVFSNLLNNALKFTPEQGTVTIRLREAANAIEATVEDTGEGIPPEDVGRIFDKFYQVAGQNRAGTGLGLTICRHIVEAHLGKIWVESALGRGSRFIFAIPKDLTPEKVTASQAKTQKSK